MPRVVNVLTAGLSGVRAYAAQLLQAGVGYQSVIDRVESRFQGLTPAAAMQAVQHAQEGFRVTHPGGPDSGRNWQRTPMARRIGSGPNVPRVEGLVDCMRYVTIVEVFGEPGQASQYLTITITSDTPLTRVDIEQAAVAEYDRILSVHGREYQSRGKLGGAQPGLARVADVRLVERSVSC